MSRLKSKQCPCRVYPWLSNFRLRGLLRRNHQFAQNTPNALLTCPVTSNFVIVMAAANVKRGGRCSPVRIVMWGERNFLRGTKTVPTALKLCWVILETKTRAPRNLLEVDLGYSGVTEGPQILKLMPTTAVSGLFWDLNSHLWQFFGFNYF